MTATWAQLAASALADTLGGWLSAPGVAVAAAVVDAGGTALVTRPADLPADGRFEVGSVTKTMTATVLAALAADAVVGLDDQIGRWLSAGPNASITLRELATHTSGLPAVAPNRRSWPADPANPWAGYTFGRAEEGLRQTTVTPGHPWRYSNLGYQLLGLILERASGQPYPALLAERVFTPLTMAHSGVGPRGAGTLLPGHGADGVVPRWDHPWGAGGVESTIGDLARYARACLFPPDTSLGAAIRLAQAPVCRVGATTEQALGWAVCDGSVVEHSGGTSGFSACVTADRRRGRAVAVLVSYGGSPALASRLRQAARLVLAGQAPQLATEPEPWPAWREAACAAVGDLLAGRFADVHGRLVAQRRDRVTVHQLERAWRAIAPGAGPAADVAVVRHEIAASGSVVADLAVTSAESAALLRIVVLPTGELGGFTTAL